MLFTFTGSISVCFEARNASTFIIIGGHVSGVFEALSASPYLCTSSRCCVAVIVGTDTGATVVKERVLGVTSASSPVVIGQSV